MQKKIILRDQKHSQHDLLHTLGVQTVDGVGVPGRGKHRRPAAGGGGRGTTLSLTVIVRLLRSMAP